MVERRTVKEKQQSGFEDQKRLTASMDARIELLSREGVMSMPQTERHGPIERKKILDEEIKKYSRQFLAKLFGAITLAKVELFRDTLDTVADVLDDYSKKMRKSKAKGLGRPSGHLVKEAHNFLTQYVGSDSAKWTEFKVWSDTFLDFLKHWPAEGESPQWDKRQFLKSISTLLRGKPGPHKKEQIFAQAAALKQKDPQKWTHSRLARHFWLDEYNKNPEKARNRMKSGLNRLRRKT